jgi:hypothetical protein
MKLSLPPNLGLNWVYPLLSFPERFQPSTAVAMYKLAINVLELDAINPESQYFIPLFNKISWLCGQQPSGDEASNEGCNWCPIGHDFTDNCIMSPFSSKKSDVKGLITLEGGVKRTCQRSQLYLLLKFQK